MPAKNRQSLRAFSARFGQESTKRLCYDCASVSNVTLPPPKRSVFAMQFILSMLLTALPAILPVFVLMCARIWPMRFRAQKVLMAAAFLCYAEALAAFALHAAEIAGGAPAFFNAFYGSPSVMTPYAMAGYAGQCLAVFALMLIVNWRAMVGYFSDEPQTKAAKSSDTEKKAAPAENSDIGKK